MSLQAPVAAASAAARLVRELSARGIRLWLDGARLRYLLAGGGLSEDDARRLRGMRDEVIELLARERCTWPAAPASQGQRALWYEYERGAGEDYSYHLLSAVRLAPDVDEQALTSALARCVKRHEILRTVYEMQWGMLWQRLVEQGEVEVPRQRLGDCGDAEWLQRIEAVGHAPFDLRRGPVFRAAILERAPGGGEAERMLVFCAHHIAMDFASLQMLMAELSEGIGGHEASRTPGQYRDFVARQARALAEPAQIERTGNLAQMLQPLPAPLPVPVPRVAGQEPAYGYPTSTWALGQERSLAISALASRLGITVFGVCFGAYALALSRLCGQARFAIQIASSLRNADEGNQVLGNFANLTPAVVEVLPQSSLEANIAKVFHAAQAALAQRDVPFPMLVEALGASGSEHRLPISPIVFTWHRDQVAHESARMKLGEVHPLSRQLGPPGSLMLTAHWSGSLLDFRITHDSRLVSPEFARAVPDAIDAILDALAERPGATASQVAVCRPAHFVPALELAPPGLPAEDAVERIISFARSHPGAPAVVHDGRTTSYGELVASAGELAQGLRSRGVLPGDRVAIHLHRGADLLPAILATLMAGAVYVPIDGAYPSARVERLIGISGACGVITDAPAAFVAATGAWTWDLSPTSASPGPSGERRESVPADSLAYLIFTSGSTGEPKGVAISRGALAAFTQSFCTRLGLGPRTRLLAVSSISFDASIAELLGTLSCGACVVLGPDGGARDPEALAALIDGERVNAMQATPTTWRSLFTAYPGRNWPLRAYSMGEALPTALGQQMLARCECAWNLYGPTEATVYVAASRVHAAQHAELPFVPIGDALPGCALWILDSALQPVAPGLVGELYLSGSHLAIGYWNNPQATAESFATLAHLDAAGTRFYRTGDLARRLRDGQVEILGRRDHQVKLRGHRIELGEIESALLVHPGVEAAVAELRCDGNVDRLVAYIQGSAETRLLGPFLAGQLPAYMVPSAFIPVGEIPVNANGKIDRVALAKATPRVEKTEVAAVVAEGTAARLLHVLGQLLERPLHDPRASIFDLGADSLKAVEFRVALKDRLGIDIPMSDIFARPGIADLADFIDGRQSLDVAYEQDLARPFEFSSHGPRPAGAIRKVLVTGATGYLGSRIVSELAKADDVSIVCLVRGADAASAMQRQLEALSRHGIVLSAQQLERIEVVAGGLGVQRLGLSGRAYAQLAGTVDSVVHCAALVNFALPYGSLRGNVHGTVQMIELCGHERPKPLHFVSTYSVLDPLAAHIGEELEVPAHDFLEFGYARSKWVCEKLLQRAADRGLDYRVYRPSRIVTGSPGQRLNPSDFYSLVLASSIAAGVAPTDAGLDNFVDVVAVASRIADAATKAAPGSRAVHLCSREWTRWDDILEGLSRLGIRLEALPYERWLERVQRHATVHRELRGLGEMRSFLEGAADRLRRSLAHRHPHIAVSAPEGGAELGVKFDEGLLASHVEQLDAGFNLGLRLAAKRAIDLDRTQSPIPSPPRT